MADACSDTYNITSGNAVKHKSSSISVGGPAARQSM